ncbi:uncharacterized protein LOC131996900 [Stomoxys calcitrans]|uniref:uncharacterized protein LOC131996900 n=1 Tax=Stomoxys calcitrans TaxID=35570 RepID=UPI0027E2ABED|nr:uncharacterized protein LOC131996900 [Stomoxys calcitrans]
MINDNLGPIINKNEIGNLNLNPAHFNAIHLNAQSIAPRSNSTKLEEIRSLFEDKIFQVIGVSETWLNASISDAAVHIDGYRVYRSDRLVQRGGGVCVYVNNALKSRVVYEIMDEGISEGIFVEIGGTGESKILVGVLYLPHGGIDSCETLLAEYTARYERVVIMGDFNVNLFENGIRMRELCSRMGLDIIHNVSPTHFSIGSQRCSLLDYYLLSNSSLIEKSMQFQFPALNSNHALICLSLNIPTTADTESRFIRDYSSFNFENCARDVNMMDLSGMYSTTDVNYQTVFMNALVLELYDRHIPQKLYKKKQTANWMRAFEIQSAQEQRDLAFRGFLEDRTEGRWRVYCKYRNRAKRIIRKRRGIFFTELFQSTTQSQTWKQLKNLGANGNSSRNLADNDVDVEGCNIHFLLPPPSGAPRLMHVNYSGERPLNEFDFHPVDETDVWNALNSIKSNAVGVDGVPIRFLRLIFPLISRLIVHLFNNILMTSSYPDAWKIARVVPIPKISRPTTPSDFRPISILPVFSKIFEILLNRQIVASQTVTRLFSNFQSGFKRHFSTTTLMASLMDEVRRNIDNKSVSILVTLDLTCSLIASFLSSRRQFVQAGNALSSTREVVRGVPQGSVLGPLFFSMYVNDIFDTLHGVVGHMYADDFQLLVSAGRDNTRELIARLQTTLNNIETWCADNFIVLNILKSKAMVFNYSGSYIPGVVIRNEMLEYVSSIKTLGFYIDNRLSFDVHINKVLSNLTFGLRKLYSINGYMPLKIRIRQSCALRQQQWPQELPLPTPPPSSYDRKRGYKTN